MKKLILAAVVAAATAGCEKKILVYDDTSMAPVLIRNLDGETFGSPEISTEETRSNITFTVVFPRNRVAK